MSITRTFQGAWRISALVGNQYVTRQYFGYTQREAIRAFRDHIGGVV